MHGKQPERQGKGPGEADKGCWLKACVGGHLEVHGDLATHVCVAQGDDSLQGADGPQGSLPGWIALHQPDMRSILCLCYKVRRMTTSLMRVDLAFPARVAPWQGMLRYTVTMLDTPADLHAPLPSHPPVQYCGPAATVHCLANEKMMVQHVSEALTQTT